MTTDFFAPKHLLALLGAAALCALASNALAPRARKLSWGGWVPPVLTVPEPARPAAVAAVASVAPPAAPAQHPQAPPKGAPTGAKPAPPAPEQAFPPAADAAYRDISSEEAWTAFQARIPFLDARRSQEFQEGHVAGAFSVPVWETDPEARITEFEARANPAPRSPIVIYCGGGGCADSLLLARKLVALGYRNLLIYRDGFPDWAGRNRPQARP